MDFAQARYNMVEQQIRTVNVFDERVLQTLHRISREHFTPDLYKNLAYSDTEVPLGCGQNMLKPVQEAKILQALDIKESDIILEVGTGSGYLTACLAKLGGYVYSVDIEESFVPKAEKCLQALSIGNVNCSVGDASEGWGKNSLYDVILISAAYPVQPDAWHHFLKRCGRMIMIIGTQPVMQVKLITLDELGQCEEAIIFETLVSEIRQQKEQEFVF